MPVNGAIPADVERRINAERDINEAAAKIIKSAYRRIAILCPLMVL